MPRNAEVIRQWNILLLLDRKRLGLSVDELAQEAAVGKRTIWRDMAALQEAGFPLTSEKRADSRTYWMLLSVPLKAVQDPGLSTTEVCSLYMSRALLGAMPGAAFTDGLSALMKKIEKGLSPRVRKFLDDMPGVIKVKAGALKKHAKNYDEIVARLIEASSGHKVAQMRYFSASSNREKDYVVHPYHVAYFDGGLYLTAFVPNTGRFATSRSSASRPSRQPRRPSRRGSDASDSPFAESLGANQGGRAERVEIEFAPRVARYVRERDWHPSQQLRELSNGGVRLTLKVCRDWALRSWVLGFGPHARVVAPSGLAQEILEQLNEARDGYAPRLALEMPATYLSMQPRLPIR